MRRFRLPRYSATGWLAASIPSTVLAAEVAAGVYQNIFFGTNLRSLPGATYPIGENFSNLPMPGDSPYRCGWWYRKQFDIAQADGGKTFNLQFDGINYSADLWVNGKHVADQSQISGAYRTYEFDVSQQVHPGKQRAGGGGVSSDGEESRHQLGGLESDAARTKTWASGRMFGS